jgi:3-dehydroquinate dehydratase
LDDLCFAFPRRQYAHAEGRGRFPPPRARPPTPSIINPAGFSFTSAGIMDAIKAFEGPVREVHISNVHAPGECQRHSMPSSTGVIWGSGPYGYITAMQTTAQMK